MSIEKMLKPRVVAVVGASEKLGFSGSVCKNLISSEISDNTYFINPKRDSVFGKLCLKSLDEVKQPIDLVIICISKDNVPNILRQMSRIGCHAAVVFASGYSETGKKEGKTAEKELAKLCSDLEISLMGPNCAGFINYVDAVPAFGLDIEKIKTHGKVGLLSQSGQICLTMMDMKYLDFSYVISAGNSSVVSMETYLDFLVNDKDTKVVALYLEGITNPSKFTNILKNAAEKRKPIIVLKTGSSQKGMEIASSHTGSLSGSDKSYDAIFKKYGVIRVADIEELIATSLLFSTINKIPEKPTFASMNLSGGETSICADLGEKCGLEFPDFTENTLAKLKTLLPDYSTPNNPLDTTATLSYDADGYSELVKTVLDDENIGMVLCGFTVLPNTKDPCISFMSSGIIKALKENPSKPLALISFAECSREEEIRDKLKKVNVPILPSTLYSFRILKYLVDYIKYDSKKRTLEDAVPNIQKSNSARCALSENGSYLLLKDAGIPVSRSQLAKTKADLKACIEITGFPAVAKICSPDILHKSDIGGVKLNIQSYEQLEKAFDDIMKSATEKCPNALIEGVLVQKMMEPGLEMIIGVNVDPQFGPMLMCGLGGVFVEIFKDVSLYPAPLNHYEAAEMLLSLKSYKLLTGYRGDKKLDIDELINTIVKVSKFAAQNKDTIAELDINPLFVYEIGVCAADALIIKNRAQN